MQIALACSPISPPCPCYRRLYSPKDRSGPIMALNMISSERCRNPVAVAVAAVVVVAAVAVTVPRMYLLQLGVGDVMTLRLLLHPRPRPRPP